MLLYYSFGLSFEFVRFGDGIVWISVNDGCSVGWVSFGIFEVE